ncbi:hypothetical protein GCM10027290_53970 [Micromonospora sonneratiae]|uniref:Uncharacterized protein n=2 Tax=Micromonospora sonneratiae TaxID=1184706 RepID=A0ABW3YEP7_9ACTN
MTFPPGGEAPVANVRVGDEFHQLSPGEYHIWLLATAHHSREALLQATRQAGYVDGDQVLEALLGLGMMIELDPEDAKLDAQLAQLRLVSIAIGIGNSAEHPEAFAIGGPDLQPRALVGLDLYTVWGMSYRASIWAVCQQIGALAEEEPAAVARRVAAGIPVLVSNSCAYLDVVP